MKSLARLFVLLIGVFVCAPARAQSEFLGEHFPYNAFDRLRTTPIEVAGGTLNVAFAPGEIALPRSALGLAHDIGESRLGLFRKVPGRIGSSSDRAGARKWGASGHDVRLSRRRDPS